MSDDNRTLADYESETAQIIEQIAYFDIPTITIRMERCAEHLERCLDADIESDDTPFGAQWSVLTLHKLLAALGERLDQLESTMTAAQKDNLRIVVQRLSAVFDRIGARVIKYSDAFAQFENLQSGPMN
jgi:hypothetical protein